MNHSYFDNKPDFKRIDGGYLYISTGSHWCDCGYISVDSEQHQEHFEKGYHEIFADRRRMGRASVPSYQEWSEVKRLAVRNLDDEFSITPPRSKPVAATSTARMMLPLKSPITNIIG
jgi:hypothetical protein